MTFALRGCLRILLAVVAIGVGCAHAQAPPEHNAAATVPYFKLSTPRRVLSEAQPWEGNEFPHTLSVLELKRGGFRYWGWYGLNEGRGIGLARSNDPRVFRGGTEAE